MNHLLRFVRLAILALVAIALAPSPASAVEPAIRAIDIRGLTVGGTTTLVIDGDDLGSVAKIDAKDPKKKSIGPPPRLLLPFSAKQELKPGATDKRAVFDVSVPDDIAPGYYNLRVTTDGGVSLPVVVAVDRLPQQAFPPKPPQQQQQSTAGAIVVGPQAPSVATLPMALHGVVGGSTVLEATFAGKAGQSFTAEIESQRLGGKLRPVVHLYGPRRAQVAWSWPMPIHSGDTRLTAVLPSDGIYTVAVHDLEYAAPAAGFFRLRLGRWSSADRVFPPAVKAGGRATLELVGTSPVERIDMASPSGAATIVVPAPKTGLWSGPRPFVQLSPSTELIEQSEGASVKPQELPAGPQGLVAPLGISGRLLKPNEEDRYRIATTPGTKLRFEVFAERIGSAADTALVVRDEKGTQLARGEDGVATIDPTLDYVVPDKTTAITVGVVDTQGRGSADAAYRLVVEPATGGPGDFRLSTVTQRLSLAAGGSAVVPVVAERRGYTGEITLAVSALPAGMKLAATKIPAEADGALVTIERSGPPAGALIVELSGNATTISGGDKLVRPVLLKGHPTERLQPWLASELAIAPTTGTVADLKIEWRNLPADIRLIPGKTLPLPIKVARADDQLPVRLSLITSQLPPVVGVNQQPDLPKTLRAEKPIELAAKIADGEIAAIAPPELANPTYDVAIQAELLTADKRTVLATAFTPVKRLPLSLPIAATLAGPTSIKAVLDPKIATVVKLLGKIERREGATGDATVSLIGLPPSLPIAPATVKAGSDEFAITLSLPPATSPAVYAGLKLSAVIVPDPKQPAVRVKSRDVDLALTIIAAPASTPAAPAPAKK